MRRKVSRKGTNVNKFFTVSISQGFDTIRYLNYKIQITFRYIMVTTKFPDKQPESQLAWGCIELNLYPPHKPKEQNITLTEASSDRPRKLWEVKWKQFIGLNSQQSFYSVPLRNEITRKKKKQNSIIQP